MSIPRLITEVIRTLFKKPVTRHYPFERPELAEGFRGKPVLNIDECVGCGMCSRDCPTGAITMVFYPKVKRRAPSFDYSKCIFCYQCIDSCPWDAIKPSKEFELATTERDILKFKVSEDKVKPIERRPPKKKPWFR